jgi:hypothetical protein
MRATASQTCHALPGSSGSFGDASAVSIRFRRGGCRESRSRSLRLRSVRLGANTGGKVRCSRETRCDSAGTRSVGDRQANQLGRGDSFKESQTGRLRGGRRLRRCVRQRSLSVLRSLIIARRSARKKRSLQRRSTDFTGRTSVARLRRPRRTDVRVSALPCISTSTETGWRGSQKLGKAGKNLQRNMHVICEQCGDSVDVDFLTHADRCENSACTGGLRPTMSLDSHFIGLD